MLDILGRTVQLCDSVSRRGFLRIGALGLGGLALPGVLRARAAQAPAARRDTAVILYWMGGGPSHLETYDMKPAAPVEVRGPFKTVKTRVPGIDLCELLPRHAQVADRLSVVRSLRHANASHLDAAHWVQTGYHVPNIIGRGQPFPAQGAVTAKLRGPVHPAMPPYVCIPESYNSARGFYQQAAYLGARYNPINSGGDESLRRSQGLELALPPHLPVPRVADRRELQRRINTAARVVESSPAFDAMDEHYQRAFELVTSARVKEAFDLEHEPAALRDRYGRNHWGQAALQARRLVEAGVTFVTINHYEADVDWWDDHYVIEKNMRKRLPVYDGALATLIEDLNVRGLADRVLVAAFGEFGRAPRVDSYAGRGHWPRAFSALFSGGGTKPGVIVGSTTSDGGDAKDRPLGPGDLLATIYRVLGIDPEQSLPDTQNRPIRLVDDGAPIEELF